MVAETKTIQIDDELRSKNSFQSATINFVL